MITAKDYLHKTGSDCLSTEKRVLEQLKTSPEETFHPEVTWKALTSTEGDQSGVGNVECMKYMIITSINRREDTISRH